MNAATIEKAAIKIANLSDDGERLDALAITVEGWMGGKRFHRLSRQERARSWFFLLGALAEKVGELDARARVGKMVA